MESNVVQLAVHEQLLAWFESHRRQVLWAAALITAGAIGVGFFVWRNSEIESDASAALSKLSARVGDPSVDAAAYLNVATIYPHTSAAARALLIGGAMLFIDGKYPQARAQFDRYLREYRDTPLASQALLGVAACLEMQGNTNDAVSAYRDIVEHHPSEPIVPQAKLALARLYEAQNKWEQARDLYQALARPGPYESISTLAAMKLKELIQKHPELAQTGSATTPGVPALKFSNP